MQRAAREGFAAGQDTFKNPYVTDGLTHWWDGLWNERIDRRNSSASAWNDLIGKIKLDLGSSSSWGENCLTSLGTSAAATASDVIPASDARTVEIVAAWASRSAYPYNRVAFLYYSGTSKSSCRVILNDADDVVTYIGGGSGLRQYYAYTPSESSPVAMGAVFPSSAGATASGFYVNGVTAYATQTRSDNRATGSGTYLGYKGRSDPPAGYVKGRFFVVRTYNRVLTAAEIRHNFEVDNQRFKVVYDAEIEYLESTGTQYIDTGVSTSEGISTEVKFKLNEITSTSQDVIGKVGAITGTMTRYWIGASGSTKTWQYAINEYVSTERNADNGIHVSVLDTVNDVFKVDGETLATFGNLNSNDLTIYLFGANHNGNNNNPMSGRIYYVRITQNGNLVRDFVPVRRGATGYMYDRVSGQLFGNAGTGDFVLGPDVNKPYDAEVEYLQSNGTQYMLFGGNINGVDMWLRPSSSNANVNGDVGRWNGGSRADTIKFNTIQSRGWIITNGSNSSNCYTMDQSRSSLRHITVRGTAITLDDASYSMGAAWRVYTTGGFNTFAFALFGCNNDGTVTCASCFIGPTKLYSGSTVIHDMIPVRVGTEGFFFDRITNRLIGSSTASSLSAGPDKTQ